MHRRLAAILVADVVGYSRLMHEDEVGTLEQLTRTRDDLVLPIIALHNGRLVKVAGDAFLVEFNSAVGAVNAALAWQETASDGAGTAGAAPLTFRIGLNLGEVIVESDDIFGDGVNVAARLERCAKPGEICISKTVLDHIAGRIDLEVRDLGALNLRNISTPVKAYIICRAGTRSATFPGSASLMGRDDMSRVLASSGSTPPELHDLHLYLPPRPVIAVLPFVNMSRDPDQEFFADGLTEDIITRLSYLRGLTVASRTSSFTFKGQSVRIQDVAKQLGVRFVLEGSVRKSGEKIRVTGQLIDGADGAHIWARKFDRQLTDIFQIQDEITQAIVVALQVELTDGEIVYSDSGSTENLDAWEAFYQAVQAALIYTPESNLRARRLFEQALIYDQDFLDARIHLAWCYWQDSHSDYAGDPARQLTCCREQVDKIKSRGVNSASALHLEAATLVLEHRYDEALAVAAEAVRKGPCKIFGLTPACLVNVFAGNLRSGLELLRTTVRQTPSTPNDTVWWLGYLLCLLGDYENGILAAEEYRRRAPHDQHSYTLAAIAYATAGQYDTARSEVQKLLQLYPTYNLRQFRHHEPFRDPAMLERVVEALRTAGMPE